MSLRKLLHLIHHCFDQARAKIWMRVSIGDEKGNGKGQKYSIEVNSSG